MSTRTSSPTVGSTLAGGIQDVAAILPLIGTEQCEKHVGSALAGGYLYAAAAPLSIFGSLGIVKAGIAILISSISITTPHISISFHNSRPSVKYFGRRKWFGARMLKDAGFELTGVVAPLIGMDGRRFEAETRVMQMLEKKHVDDPDKISVHWKSQQWNFMLVISTILGAALSLVPYIALLLGPTSWRPTSIHLPWLFPALRIVGSCTATVACQYLLQSRVISLMKNRILFMTIQRRLDATLPTAPKFEWDTSLPAEQCIWNLGQYYHSSLGSRTHPVKDSKETKDQTITEEYATPPPQPYFARFNYICVQMGTQPEGHALNFQDLCQLQREHFPTPTLDAVVTSLLWILLGLSLPATVAGYIGCFTLVSATPTLGNGPLVWVGLEAGLSILRIFVWASNPTFDEETEITLQLKLSEHQPMVTTEDYNPWLTQFTHDKKKPFTLLPEREFLEWITPFTGPLDQFQKADNITIYFTLSTEYEINAFQWNEIASIKKPEFMCLFMTVFDSNMQVAVSFMFSEEHFHYYDVGVQLNTNSQKLEASVRSHRRETCPWRIEDLNLFNSLEEYYQYVVGALSGSRRDNNRLAGKQSSCALENAIDRVPTATLSWKWDLTPRSGPEKRGSDISPSPTFPMLTDQDQAFLNRGYEHQLKSDLVTKWSKWIVDDMRMIQSHSRLDCYEALRDVISEKAKWELTELDTQLVWGWARRELGLLNLSKELEDILRAKMETCISEINDVRKEKRLGKWTFESGRRKRMEQERVAAKKRMEKAMKDASIQADREGRSWQLGEPDYLSILPPQWRTVMEFIDKSWLAAINSIWEGLSSSENELDMIIRQHDSTKKMYHHDRWPFVVHFSHQVSHEHWLPQHRIEEQMMKATVEYIRTLPADSTRRDMNMGYEYPNPDAEATVKFASLIDSSSRGRACSAIVYDARHCSKEAVCNVIANTSTRSVINVDASILPSISPNDHLLFLTSRDREGQEPAFVRRNRERWWDQQTTNSAIFYFTPSFINGDSCAVHSGGESIARIFVFLTLPSAVRVSVLSRSQYTNNVLSIRENERELGSISNIPSNFQLHKFQSVMLQPGRHVLDLVPQEFQVSTFDYYYLRDIFVELSDDPTVTSTPTGPSCGSFQSPTGFENPESTVYNGWTTYLPRVGTQHNE